MNGVHDLGGMHGFGPVRPETNEPVFHAAWEGRVLAMNRLMAGWKLWNIDSGRHSIELLPPPDYLGWTYYEKWLQALTNRSLAHGLITAEELASGHKAPDAPVATPPLTVGDIETIIAAKISYERAIPEKPRFAAGDAVRAKMINPEGHTRLPRYARGRFGTILRDHGAHVFPDVHAHAASEAPQTLYTVGFTARELWGESAKDGDIVYLDLWESYLDAA